MIRILPLLLLVLPACLEPAPHQPPWRESSVPEGWHRDPDAELEQDRLNVQSMVGVSHFESVVRKGGRMPSLSTDGIDRLPFIAGAHQESLGGNENFDYGLEGGGSLGFVTGGGFVAASGGGGLVLAVDIDFLLLDLFIGPFVSVNWDERIRFYVAAGPLLDFADFSQRGQAAQTGGPRVNDHGTGIGLGWYARGGGELALGGGFMLGAGYRWIDTSIVLSDGLGTLDLRGSQFFLSLSRGF